MLKPVPPERDVSTSISVVICTHNGASRIGAALEALAQCEADVPTEIILVDNNSSDDTVRIAREVWSGKGDASVPLRVAKEPQLGLSFARRAGVRAAVGELIVFCDDDNLLCGTYLRDAAEIMKDPTIIALGGAGIPVFESEPQPHVWSILPWLACGAQFVEASDLERRLIDVTRYPQKGLFGAGLVVRREDVLRLYELEGFPILAGRTGESLSTGEDTEIVHALALMGGRLCASQDLKYKHLIPASRTREDYFVRLMEGWRVARRTTLLYIALRSFHLQGKRYFRPSRVMRAFRSLLGSNVGREERFVLLCALGLPQLMRSDELPVWEIYRSVRPGRGSAVDRAPRDARATA